MMSGEFLQAFTPFNERIPCCGGELAGTLREAVVGSMLNQIGEIFAQSPEIIPDAVNHADRVAVVKNSCAHGVAGVPRRVIGRTECSVIDSYPGIR